MNRCDVALGLKVIKNGPKRPSTIKKPTIALPTVTLRLAVIARQVTSNTFRKRAGSGSPGKSATGAALAGRGISWVCITTRSFPGAHGDRGKYKAYRPESWLPAQPG